MFLGQCPGWEPGGRDHSRPPLPGQGPWAPFLGRLRGALPLPPFACAPGPPSAELGEEDAHRERGPCVCASESSRSFAHWGPLHRAVGARGGRWDCPASCFPVVVRGFSRFPTWTWLQGCRLGGVHGVGSSDISVCAPLTVQPLDTEAARSSAGP